MQRGDPRPEQHRAEEPAPRADAVDPHPRQRAAQQVGEGERGPQPAVPDVRIPSAFVDRGR